MSIALFVDTSAVAAPYRSALNDGLALIEEHLDDIDLVFYADRPTLAQATSARIVVCSGACALVDALCEIVPKLKRPKQPLLVIIIAVGEDNASRCSLAHSRAIMHVCTSNILYCAIDHNAQVAASRLGIDTALEAFGAKQSVAQMFRAIREVITRFRNSGSI